MLTPLEGCGSGGTCKNTSKGCSGGSFASGLCPGDSSIQCCVPSSGGSSGISAFDISSAQPSAFWTCAAGTYKKAVIRGYQQACGSGGQVDSNLATSYRAAKAAGLTNVDAYMFPCTGTPKAGQPACKSPATQIADFEAAVRAAGLASAHLWLDIEPCASSSPCNCWNQGATQNLAVAKQFVSIMRQSSFKWGIYANPNQWSGIFASKSTDVASDLPWWVVDFDNTPGVNTVTNLCGGWTKAYAKQYSLSVTECGSNLQGLDLDSFTA